MQGKLNIEKIYTIFYRDWEPFFIFIDNTQLIILCRFRPLYRAQVQRCQYTRRNVILR